jgi:hypothetical protein
VKNAMGLQRSKEFMKSNPEKAPQLHHLRVTPHEGGVKVTHHASPTAPPFATHQFGHGEGAELADHLMEHTGMSLDSEGGGEHYPDEDKEIQA